VIDCVQLNFYRMLKNYILVAFRNLFRNKLHSIINITGLAVGIACGVMIFSFVQYELSFDKYHKNAEHIYRISLQFSDDDIQESFATNFPNVYREMLPEYPEIEASTRIMDRGFSGTVESVRVEEKVFTSQTVYHADSTFFRIFQFPMIKGNPDHALNDLNTGVITESTALKYFGTTDVLGNIFMVDGVGDIAVSGVIEDIPDNTHFNFDVLLPIKNVTWEPKANWNGLIFATYVLLNDGVSPDALAARIDNYFQNTDRFKNKQGKVSISMPLQSIGDIHLTSHLQFELLPNGEYKYVIIFTSIAFFIILIACINYVNLATARAMERAREVGLRKVFGAIRPNLIRQFLGESLVIVVVSFIIALGIIELLRPSFNQLTGIHFTYASFFSDRMWLKYLLLGILMAIASGLYPSFILSAFKPDRVLKGQFMKSITGGFLRKILVVFQFTISIFLIIGSLVIFRQMNHIRNKNLGIEKDHIVIIPMQGRDIVQKYETIKSSFLEYHNVLGATAVSQVPINVTLTEGISFNLGHSDENPIYNTLEVDQDFFKTMGVEFTEGTGFHRKYSKDYTDYIVNEAGVDQLVKDGEAILGKSIRVKHGGITLGPVIGIVKDFNFASLHGDIGPLVICQNPRSYSTLLVKIRPEEIDQTIDFMKDKWKEFSNGASLDYSFMDGEFDNIYKMEKRVGQIFIVFMMIAIFIACIGLFGLTSYTTIRRTKEVGIRKVLGSSVFGIAFMFFKENIQLILYSLIISIPFGYFIMNAWLADFAYRINLDWRIFLISGGTVLLLAILTVLFHAVKTALVNPADSLRYE